MVGLNYDELINAATDVGHMLLANGAEIYRVEESMQRIFYAYGVETGEVFAIPTCINVSIHTPEGRPITLIRRVPERSTNLDRLERLNDLCRRVCGTVPELANVREDVAAIGRRPIFGFWQQAAAFGLVSFAFTLFFGANLRDACCAIACGFSVKVVSRALNQVHVNAFFTNIVASCCAATLAMFAVHFGLGFNLDKIIIGALMNLVPGIVITSFMRDIMAGDLVAGLIRFTESLLVAVAIAIGAGLALTVPRLIWGV